MKSPAAGRVLALLPVAAAIVLGLAYHLSATADRDHSAEIAFTPAQQTPASRIREVDPAMIAMDELHGLLLAVGWPPEVVPEAMQVAACESAFRRITLGSYGEFGIFQIHPVHLSRFEARYGARTNPFDPEQNATIALEIWREYGWQPWSCQP